MADKKSCWTCEFQKIGGPTFLGVCTYFATVGKPNKDIPPGLVDVGCKQWKLRPVSEDVPIEDPDA